MTAAWIILAAYGLGALPDDASTAPPLEPPSAKSPTADVPTKPAKDSAETPTRDAAPRLFLLDSPYGLAAGAAFAGATGEGLWANRAVESDSGEQSSAAYGGGVLLGFSPLSRLTLSGFIGRDTGGRWSPSATAHYRLAGAYGGGGAFGALARYTAEGFSELGGEAETGFTGGVRAGRFYMNANLIGGAGIEAKDDGELDAEAMLAAGYDVSATVRVGGEGRVRHRVSGHRPLVGGHSTDALAGPALTISLGPVLVSGSGGASTVHVASGVGAYGMLTVASVVE